MSCPCHECHATQLAAILQDLIAELRDIPTQEHVRSVGAIVDIFSAIKPSTCVDTEQVEQAIDRAEARLRSILTDLIAELRQSEDHSDYSLVQMSCMRAELRLKEVQGE